MEESTVSSGTLRTVYCTAAQMIPTSQSGTCRLARHGGQCSLSIPLKTSEFNSFNKSNEESLVVGRALRPTHSNHSLCERHAVNLECEEQPGSVGVHFVLLWPDERFQSTLTCLASLQPPRGRQTGKLKFALLAFFFLVVKIVFRFFNFIFLIILLFHSVAFKF